jgi:hypothetical protein
MLTPSSNSVLEPVCAALLAGVPDVSAHFARFRATGIPATSSVLALFEALRQAGMTRIGLVSPYLAAVQERIIATFRAEAVAVVAERHLGLSENFTFAIVAADCALDRDRSWHSAVDQPRRPAVLQRDADRRTHRRLRAVRSSYHGRQPGAARSGADGGLALPRRRSVPWIAAYYADDPGRSRPPCGVAVRDAGGDDFRDDDSDGAARPGKTRRSPTMFVSRSLRTSG